MKEEEILLLRDLVSCTVENLILTTADIKKELIVINLFGREIELPTTEVKSHSYSCRDFLNYLREKLK